jgi:hypothetical protein
MLMAQSSSTTTIRHMRWHKEGVRENEQVMVHPADDKSWKVLEGPEKGTKRG